MIVKNNTASTMGMHTPTGFFSLLPGVNRIEKGLWEEFIKNPARRFQLAEGALEVVEEDELPSLKMKSPKDAVVLVKGTVRKDLLEAWFAEENRKVVLEAIEKQLAAIEPARTPTAEGDESDADEDEES